MSLAALLRRAVVALLVAPIRVYRYALSPLLPRVCRFHPSCSLYAMEALSVHGPARGSWLALRRLLRCQPFHPGGLDPVPPNPPPHVPIPLPADAMSTPGSAP